MASAVQVDANQQERLVIASNVDLDNVGQGRKVQLSQWFN